MTSLVTDTTNKDECLKNAEFCEDICKKDLGIGQWSFIGPGS